MLTELAIKNLKPKTKPYRVTDGSGLYLWVPPAGGRYWRWRYERQGREQLLSLGAYPEVKLAEARERRNQARRIVKDGGDPAAAPATPAGVLRPWAAACW